MSADKSNYKDAISRSTRGLPNWYFYLLYINGGLLVLLGLLLPVLLGMPYSDSWRLACIPLILGVVCLMVGWLLQKMQGKKKQG